MEQPILSEKQLQAKALFEAGYNCSQSVAGAFWQEMGLPKATVLATVTGFGGGFARLREVCGAVSGMVAAISAVQQKYGVTPDGKKKNYPLVQQYISAFEDHFGSYLCRELLGLRSKERQLPIPSERTPEWYANRPCLDAILYAVQLTEQALLQSATAFEQTQAAVRVIDRAFCRANRPVRPTDGHKGSFGTVACLCGCAQYRGAAVLACTGALRAGAGLVRLAAPEPVIAAVAAARPEVTFFLPEQGCSGDRAETQPLASLIQSATVLLAGCGLGRAPQAFSALKELLTVAASRNIPTVLDADGLYFLPELAHELSQLPPLIITPHPGEAARLLQTTVAQISPDPAAAACRLAREYHSVAVLKGSATYVATPDGQLAGLCAPNDGLATGGSGDLLAGIIAGLTAQSFAPFGESVKELSWAQATQQLFANAACGVWLHSDAADRAGQKRSSASLLPLDIAEELQ